MQPFAMYVICAGTTVGEADWTRHKTVPDIALAGLSQ